MHLLMKSLFTVAFCMTLRQMLIEREIQNRKLRIKLTDTAREILAKHQFEMESEIIKTAVNVMRKTCIFGWMWMIVLVLLVMSLTGKDQITFFQIVDMSFFLVFVLMFQLSLKLWLRALKIFWLTLILYSMMALLLVYIYQFDDFPTDLISWLIIIKNF